MPPEPQAGSKMRPWIRLDDLDDQLDERGRREELAALLALGHRELAEEVFVDPAEGVAFDVWRNPGEGSEQRDEGVVVEPLVGLRQDVPELLVLGLDGAHRVVDRLADVLALGKFQERRKRAFSGR